jgi:hypothetical protein
MTIDQMGEALTRFRQEYGALANPEDLPEQWEEILLDTEIEIE